jgi:hypothetical protein
LGLRHSRRAASARRRVASDQLQPAAVEEDLWTLPAPSVEASEADRTQLKRRLLELAAVTARGQAANFSARVDAEDTVLQLESLCPTPPAAFEGALTGRWRLVYSSVELFRSSPFFWSFSAASLALLGSEEPAAAVFRITNSLPVAGARGPFGVIQLLLEPGRVVSEVAMSVLDGLLPGLSGTVVTEGRLAVAEPVDSGGCRLRVTVASTRVAGSSLGLDSLSVPVESLFSALRGGAELQVTALARYVDADLLVLRLGEREDAILVYARA